MDRGIAPSGKLMWTTLCGTLMCAQSMTSLLTSGAILGIPLAVAAIVMTGVVVWRVAHERFSGGRSRQAKHPDKSDREVVMVFRWDGSTLEANQSSVNSCWYPLPELLAASADALGKDSGPWDEQRACSRLEEQMQLQAVHRGSDGVAFPVQVNARRIGRNRIQCIIRNPDRQAATEHRPAPLKKRNWRRKSSTVSTLFPAVSDQALLQPNPLFAKTQTGRAITRARQREGKCALLTLEIHRFHALNETLGFEVGYRVLQSIVERLQRCLRSIDSVTRMEGGQFLIVLSCIDNLDWVSLVAARILDAVTAPIEVQDLSLLITVSVGAAVYPDHGHDYDALRSLAETATQTARKAGPNAFRFCTRTFDDGADRHMLILEGIRGAIARQEFLLHYQPVIDLRSGRIAAFEALIRWQHPQLGLVPPGRFIPVAESTGLIVEIGEWALHEACREAARWQKMGFDIPTMAVNLSAVQFQRSDVVKTIRSALSESRLHPSILEVELTESLLLEDSSDVLCTLRRLRELGLTLSLDDFGAGYSGFAYLRNFELDKLKIDRCLVSNIAIHPKEDAIVRSIVHLARSFGLRTVAEGVEDLAALEAVRRAGCDEVQGYYFAKPMPSSDLSDYLRTFRGCIGSIHLAKAGAQRHSSVQ